MKPRVFVFAGFAGFAGAIVVLSIAIWFWLRPAPAPPELAVASAPFQKREIPPAALANTNSNDPADHSPLLDPDLRIRVAGDARNILVKFSNPSEIYKYEIGTKTIAPASGQEWLAAEKEVSCRQQGIRSRDSGLYIDDPKGFLQDVKNRSYIETATPIALDFSESPENDLVAVLSAPGPRTPHRPGLIFGGSGGEARGKRYVQILDRASRQYVTAPIGLEGIREFPYYRFCWPEGGKTLVVYEVDFLTTNAFETAFHVIETGR